MKFKLKSTSVNIRNKKILEKNLLLISFLLQLLNRCLFKDNVI